jgi:NADPH-dependent curcumin reductase CurA
LFEVLRKECPKGVDVVYESVGGSTFEAAVANLAVGGRLVVIGSISGYTDGSAFGAAGGAREGKPSTPLPMKLMAKSASVRGMFLNHFAAQWGSAGAELQGWIAKGELKPIVDLVSKTVADIPDAVERMYEGGNTGKIVVRILPDTSAKL